MRSLLGNKRARKNLSVFSQDPIDYDDDESFENSRFQRKYQLEQLKQEFNDLQLLKSEAETKTFNTANERAEELEKIQKNLEKVLQKAKKLQGKRKYYDSDSSDSDHSKSESESSDSVSDPDFNVSNQTVNEQPQQQPKPKPKQTPSTGQQLVNLAKKSIQEMSNILMNTTSQPDPLPQTPTPTNNNQAHTPIPIPKPIPKPYNTNNTNNINNQSKKTPAIQITLEGLRQDIDLLVNTAKTIFGQLQEKDDEKEFKDYKAYDLNWARKPYSKIETT